jgi:large subunit ribosomal protein L24
MNSIKKNDKVIVIGGAKQKDKNKTGKVLKVIKDQNRVIVEGVNMRIKHVKPTTEVKQAGRIDIEGSIHISNVALYCENCKKGVRTGRKILSDGTKVRFCKKCGETFNED